jgi:predicted outer membrane repeat protein
MDARRLFTRGLESCVLFLLAAGSAVFADTLYVDAGGGTGYFTVGRAIDAAQDGDTIVVLPGTYTGPDNTNLRIEDMSLTFCSSDPNDPAVVAATVIDGSGSGEDSARLFSVTGTATPPRVTVAGLTLRNAAKAYGGGALLCQQADLSLVNCTILNCRTTWSGGAVYLTDCRATIRGCAFRGCAADNLGGGVLYARNSEMNLVNCSFDGNKITPVQSFDGALSLSRCSFSDNTGAQGGAIYDSVSLALAAQMPLTVTGCSFVRNAATASGGALYIDGAPATISRCTFTADSAGADGGAVCCSWSSPLIDDCTFISNIASGNGGALFSSSRSGPQVTFCTFVANSAAGGGAAASKLGGSALFSHCILWNNAGSPGKSLYLVRPTGGQTDYPAATVEYCDVQGGRSGTAVESGCTLTWSAGNIDADPLFVGPYQNDYHLSPDSPCIDSGNPALVPSADAVDLEGYPRRFNDTVDIGAYEYQGLGPVYRFWSASLGTHFYTISGGERDKLVNKYSHVWQFEGVAFYAFYRPTAASLEPVYRFWSPTLGSHFWTADEDQKNRIISQMSDTWVYEGIVFYAYAARSRPFGAVPVHRFYFNRDGTHFYTASENESKKLQQDSAWIYEGVAWYAFTRPLEMPVATYLFTGGSKAASYSMTLDADIDGVQANLSKPLVQLAPQGTQASMTIDFVHLQTTLGEFHVQTGTVQHATTVSRPGVSIPVTLSAKATFDGLTARGPYRIDPATNQFADYVNADQILPGDKETFDCSGTVSVGGQVIRFDHSAGATQFELGSVGVYESLSLLPDGLYARMPLTFQWHRPLTRELLVQTSVGGHLLQIYVTSLYVGALDVWQGQFVK